LGALDDVARAWERSDTIFDALAPEALLARPIPLRQPFLFYLGHLPAFAWAQIGRWLLAGAPMDPALDELFARGIDPLGVDEYVSDSELAWPAPRDVLAYRDRVREALREAAVALDPARDRDALVLGTVLEHELMHQETLLYMARRLPLEQLRRPPGLPDYVYSAPAECTRVDVPAGLARLGRPRGGPGFGWDNEFPAAEVEVPAFAIESTPVRNRDFLEFMEDGGYERQDLWTEEGWDWRQRRQVWHPPFWRRHQDGHWLYRTVFDELPLEHVLDWPASVSWSEAAAFARWRGGRLPSEAELQRAAQGAPWGEETPSGGHGNFGFRHWSPTPVGHFPAGASAWGVLDLVGNGWEWTSTTFGPLPGFEPMPNYPGYSADFFGEGHYVLLGASWATDDRLVRRSFRNWFQPQYPHTFSKFRVVYYARPE
ncbi:MAG TPA: SUMF1/EgtB/PvdO family nonheme iron enzyme, partial [Vicinamibacteria bacterium]|nr:SUMF1/EgtB/PvdO family nonheme iron enzyme [Vicinamibacteria bacterium]